MLLEKRRSWGGRDRSCAASFYMARMAASAQVYEPFRTSVPLYVAGRGELDALSDLR